MNDESKNPPVTKAQQNKVVTTATAAAYATSVSIVVGAKVAATPIASSSHERMGLSELLNQEFSE